MQYTYAYKTSDGRRHEAAMNADSREAVFAALRAQGIKPIKVVAADGSKANGERRGVRASVVVAYALAAAAFAGAAAFLLRPAPPPPEHTTPRHQIYGDPALVEAIARGRLEAWLPRPGDRFLAWFAQPGRIACPRETALKDLQAPDAQRLADLAAALDADLAIDAAEPREIRELKQIINGMHAEMRAYLANGNGTVRSYARRLLERTQQEAQIYERTCRELEGETDDAVWERSNDALRRIGLRTVPNPRDT